MKAIVPLMLIFLVGCRSASYSNVADVLERNGFSKDSVFVQIRVGNLTKNVNEYAPKLFDALRHSTMVSRKPFVPDYLVAIEKGSSSPSQFVSVEVEQSGTGSIDYQGTKTFFKSAEFATSCAEAFAASTIVVGNVSERR